LFFFYLYSLPSGIVAGGRSSGKEGGVGWEKVHGFTLLRRFFSRILLFFPSPPSSPFSSPT